MFVGGVYRAFVGLVTRMHSHVYEQLVPGVERTHAPGAASPLARVLRAGASGSGVHVQFFDVPYQRFLTWPIDFYRAPFPFARQYSVAGIACKNDRKIIYMIRPYNVIIILCSCTTASKNLERGSKINYFPYSNSRLFLHNS